MTGGSRVLAFPSSVSGGQSAEPVSVPVMWSVRQAAAETGLPEHFIRTLVKQGRIYSVQAGSRKFYVSASSLCKYLAGSEVLQ